jgi:hypothetical protein
MAEKPSILQAQTLPFMSLFRSCLISSSRMYGKAGGILLAIIAVVGLFLTFGGTIWSAIATAFWAVIGFLHLGPLISFVFGLLAGTMVFIWNTAVAVADGAYTLTQHLLPGVLEFTVTTCREITNTVDGKEVKSQLCDGTLTVHFPASGMYGAIVAAQ